jgi:hypothetical protein
MKQALDQEFAKFSEKSAEVLRTIAGEGAVQLETLWKVLVYIFELNYLALYDKNDGEINFKGIYEFERNPLKEFPRHDHLAGLLKSAFEQSKPKSRQKERELKDGMLLVEAVAAIPMLIDGTKKVLVICKHLEIPKAEVVEGYVFDSYKLQLYLSVIKSFVRIHEQQKQLIQSKSQIIEQQRQLVQNKSQIGVGRLAAIAGGIFALLEGLDAIIGVFKASSIWEVVMGLITIGLLVFFGFVIFRLGTSKKIFNILE